MSTTSLHTFFLSHVNSFASFNLYTLESQPSSNRFQRQQVSSAVCHSTHSSLDMLIPFTSQIHAIVSMRRWSEASFLTAGQFGSVRISVNSTKKPLCSSSCEPLRWAFCRYGITKNRGSIGVTKYREPSLEKGQQLRQSSIAVQVTTKTQAAPC